MNMLSGITLETYNWYIIILNYYVTLKIKLFCPMCLYSIFLAQN